MMQTPQDEIAAIQATLALHAEDLELIKQQLPEIAGAVRQAIEQATAEFVAAHERIERELNAVRERQEAQAGEISSIKETLTALVIRTDALVIRTDALVARIDEVVDRTDVVVARIDEVVDRTDVVVARIDEVVDRTDVVVARIDEVVDRTDVVVAHIAELKASTDAMSRTLTETSSRVGNLTGSRFERRVARIIRRRTSLTIGLSQAQVLHTDWGETDAALLTTLNDADAISDDEYEDLLNADIILAGQNAAGQLAYAVVEIGVTVNSTHVNRAVRRARALAKAIGDECGAIVVGSEIPDAERERATGAGAAVIAVAAPED